MITLHIDEQLGWRGGEQQASYLVRGLAERGHTVIVAGRKRGLFLQRDHGVDGLVKLAAPFVGELDLYTVLKLARAVRRHAVDVIHAHTGHAHHYACLARRFAGRGKVVVSRRVDFVPSRNFVTRWKYSQPDRIIAVSEFIARVLRRYGVDDSRLTVVHSAQDPARFDVAPAPRASLDVPDTAPLLVCVAALVGHKDHATLLNAMPAVLRRIPDLHLVLVGEGRLRSAIEDKIRDLNLAENVRLLGHRDDVPRILRAADAFVLSSKMEGFGGVCLEAMLCGLPVVACAAGGIPESVRHEETGLLVPPRNPDALAEAVLRVFREPDLARQLVANAHRLVERQGTVEKMVEGNLRVYEGLLSSGS